MKVEVQFSTFNQPMNMQQCNKQIHLPSRTPSCPRFRGYDDAEKKNYKLTIMSSDDQESRPITALDELFRALFFMTDYLNSKQKGTDKSADDTSNKRRKVGESNIRRAGSNIGGDDDGGDQPDPHGFASAQTLEPEHEAVFALCIKVFLTFAFTGEAVVNCKLFRTWSLLRTELQSVVLKVQQQFELDSKAYSALSVSASKVSNTPATGSESKSSSKKSNPLKSLNALELAEMLCSTFVDKAPTSVATTEDDEEAALQRVAMIMKGGVTPTGRKSGSPTSELAYNIQRFVVDKMVLPLSLHDPPRKALQVLAEGSRAGASEKDLVDVIALSKAAIEDTIPFSWVMFASDVSELYSDKGHWPEGSDQAHV